MYDETSNEWVACPSDELDQLMNERGEGHEYLLQSDDR